MPDSPLTLILGGGFTGLFTAFHLSRQRYARPVILIDQTERFIFQPLLYELLSGEMVAEQVWPRYEELLQGSGITFVQDTVQAIDLERRQVNLASGTRYCYSHLVLALGSTTGYFGVEGAAEHSFAFRTGEDAMVLARHLRRCLQQAQRVKDPQQHRALLSVGVIGAGPTGVELAGTLADLLPAWYSELGGNAKEIRITLINRGPEILERDVNRPIRQAAQDRLRRRTVPVECLMEAEVTAVYPQGVAFKRHNQLQMLSAATIVWTAGTATHPLIEALAVPASHRDSQGRLRVTPTLQLPDFPEVFAGGDCATTGENSLPAMAQVAYQQGTAIARNLKAVSQGNSPSPAHVTLRGSFLKLGVGESAVNLFDRFAVTGKLGHLIRQGTYLDRLPPPGLHLSRIAQWLQRELLPQPQPRQSRLAQWLGGAVAATVLAGSGLLLWRVTQPDWQPTGLPTLFDRLPLRDDPEEAERTLESSP